MFHRHWRTDWHSLTIPQRISRVIMIAVGSMFMITLVGGVFSIAIYYLWNYLMPDLFWLPKITLLQAFLLAVLSRLLLGGVGHHGHGHHGHKHFRQYRERNCSGHSRENRQEFGNLVHNLYHMYHADRQDWRRYGEYWKERGRSDFEAWLKEEGDTSRNDEKSD